MASPLDSNWNNTIISDENLNKTTHGSGTAFPSTWRTDRLFFRSDTQKLYKNAGTEASPSWTEMGASGISGNTMIFPYSTTESDYSSPSSVTVSSELTEDYGFDFNDNSSTGWTLTADSGSSGCTFSSNVLS